MKTNKILKYILVILAIFIPFREVIALYTHSFIKLVPDLIVYPMFLIIVFKKKFKLNIKKYDWLFLAFLISAFISTLVSHSSLLAFCIEVRSVLTMYTLFFNLRNLDLDFNDYKPALYTLFGILTVLTLTSSIEYISNKTLMFPADWAKAILVPSNFVRAYSFLNNPNTFAFFTFLVMFLFFYLEEKNLFKVPKIIYFFTFLIMFITASRSTMLVLIAFLILFVTFLLKKKNYAKIGLIILFLVSSFGLTRILDYTRDKFFLSNDTENKIESVDNSNNNPFLNRWDETSDGITYENSKFNGRIYRIKLGLTIFKENPLGTGYGTFGSAGARMVYPKELYQKYNLDKGFYSDNEYIKILVETGIMGTIIFIIFALLFLFANRNIYYCFLILVFFFMGMFYNVFETQPVVFIFYLTLSLMENKEKPGKKSKKVA